MMNDTVYLDHNATAPVLPQVVEAMGEALAMCGNGSSVHRAGRLANARLEGARDSVASLMGARSSDIVFTSGGTEANNLALTGTGREHLIISAVEHDSVRQVKEDAKLIPVDGEGLIDLDALEKTLKDNGAETLVSVMAANNETGVIQPVAKVAEIAKKYGAFVHCDAVQALGKTPMDLKAWGVDLASISAHKIGGPQGVGALVRYNGDLQLKPLLRGGGQERGNRAGTENLSGIVGFGIATAALTNNLSHPEEFLILRDSLETRIAEMVPTVKFFGKNVERLPNTSCFTMPGVLNETQVMAFDLAGIMISAGSACSSGKVQSSHVLEAMGIEKEEAETAIRVSFGWGNTEKDVDNFIKTWSGLYGRLGVSEHQAVSAA